MDPYRKLIQEGDAKSEKALAAGAEFFLDIQSRVGLTTNNDIVLDMRMVMSPDLCVMLVQEGDRLMKSLGESGVHNQQLKEMFEMLKVAAAEAQQKSTKYESHQ